jgi:uncharacterized protein YndB with AHSA1/START domain
MTTLVNNENNEYQLFKEDKVCDTANKTDSKGTIVYEGEEYVSLTFRRILPHPRELIWKEITDPKQLSVWMNTKATINRGSDGKIDFVNTISGFHTSGKILVWEPNKVFEHEWHIAPNPSLPQGEPNSIIRWKLEQDGNSNTVLTFTHRQLSKSISLRFAPGWHAYLDRLEADLDNRELPDWIHRFGEVKGLYSS